MNKLKYRKICRKIRTSLNKDDVREASKIVSENLIRYVEKYVSTKEKINQLSQVFLYYPMDNEIDIFGQGFFLGKKNIPIYLPRCLNESDLEFRCFDSIESLQKDRRDFLVPNLDALLGVPNKSTLIVVPCLGVSRRGNRIGYGKGYYDRYLDKHRAQLNQKLIVCVCYGKILELLDNAEKNRDQYWDIWDYRPGVVITENETIEVVKQ